MMEKQQKILQMTKDICRHQNVCNDVCKPISACDALRYAERAVEAGYVKVVRCKECRLLKLHSDGHHYCESTGADIKSNEFECFCAWGERSRQCINL